MDMVRVMVKAPSGRAGSPRGRGRSRGRGRGRGWEGVRVRLMIRVMVRARLHPPHGVELGSVVLPGDE